MSTKLQAARAAIGDKMRNLSGTIDRVSSQKNTKPSDDIWICKKCQLKFKEEGDRILECEYCRNHMCAKCLGVQSNPQYSVMTREDTMWLCSNECRELLRNAVFLHGRLMALDQLIKKVDDIEKTVCGLGNKVEESLEPFKQTVSRWDEEMSTSSTAAHDQEATMAKSAWSVVAARHQTSDSIKTKFGEALEEHDNEQVDRNKRARNVLIFGAIESKEKILKKRDEHDKALIKGVCEAMEIEEVEVEGVKRLGKQGEETRPLHVVFKDLDNKAEFMSNLRSLKDADEPFKGMGIRHDLTPNQRMKLKALREEANAIDQSGNYPGFVHKVFSGSGPTWDPKITKLKARAPLQQQEGLPPQPHP